MVVALRAATGSKNEAKIALLPTALERVRLLKRWRAWLLPSFAAMAIAFVPVLSTGFAVNCFDQFMNADVPFTVTVTGLLTVPVNRVAPPAPMVSNSFTLL